MDIGTIIHDRRTDLGLTLEEIGNKVGVGKSTVQKWEKGNISNMKRDKIALLASTLHISPISFIVGELIPEENKTDFYRVLLSDQGLKTIIKQLRTRIEKYGIDELAADIGVDFQDIKIFLSADLMHGHRCLEKLEDILIALDTNIYELISCAITSPNNADESFALYQALDYIDKAEIRGEMKNMLKADKYHAATSQKQPYTAQIAAVGSGVQNIEVNVDMDEVQKIYDDLD